MKKILLIILSFLLFASPVFATDCASTAGYPILESVQACNTTTTDLNGVTTLDATTTGTIRGKFSTGTGISYDNSTGIITNSSPDQTVSLSNGTGISISGTYPSFTITNSAPMSYPGAGIALSTGSAWGTSITNNSSNWNTAYGWGNHASAGYLTIEVDGSVTNEIQDLSLSVNTLSLSGDATTVDLSGYLDNTDAQDLSLTGDTLSLSGDATTVDLSGYYNSLSDLQGSVSNDFHNLGGTDDFLTEEEVEDYAGGMVTGNTETGITVTYEDTDGTLDFVLDSDLVSIAALGSAADKGLYTTAANTWAEFSLTAAGRAILDDANAAAQATTLGLGTGDSPTWAGGTFTGAVTINDNDGTDDETMLTIGDSNDLDNLLVWGQASIGTTDNTFNLTVTTQNTGGSWFKVGFLTAAGEDAGSYPSIGYNLRGSGGGSYLTYDATDYASWIKFDTGKILFNVAPVGTVGNTISTYTNTMTMLNNGDVGIRISPTVGFDVAIDTGMRIVTISDAVPIYLYLAADQQDDNADRRVIALADGGLFTIQGLSTGSWVEHLAIDASGNNIIMGTSPQSGYELTVNNDIYAVGDISGLTITDRASPIPEGRDKTVLDDIKAIKIVGEEDKKTLPDYIQSNHEANIYEDVELKAIPQAEAFETVMVEQDKIVPAVYKSVFDEKTQGYITVIDEPESKILIETKQTFDGYEIKDGDIVEKYTTENIYEKESVPKVQLRADVYFDSKTGLVYQKVGEGEVKKADDKIMQTIKTGTKIEEGRNVGMSLSMHDVAIQKLIEKIEALEAKSIAR